MLGYLGRYLLGYLLSRENHRENNKKIKNKIAGKVVYKMTEVGPVWTWTFKKFFRGCFEQVWLDGEVSYGSMKLHQASQVRATQCPTRPKQYIVETFSHLFLKWLPRPNSEETNRGILVLQRCWVQYDLIGIKAKHSGKLNWKLMLERV